MRSRVVGSVLFGLGVLALVVAGGLAFLVAPAVAQLPYDLERTQTVAEAPNAEFLQITSGNVEVNSATLRSIVTVTPQADETARLEGDLDGEAVVWSVGQEVIRTDTNALVGAYSTQLALDRHSGAAADWDEAWLNTTGEDQRVAYRGQIYKFPFGTEKRTYEIYDRDLGGARPARFVKTETIEGLETYLFTQDIRDERIALPADRLQLLLGVFAPGATGGELIYSNTRSVWVEPTTGQFIKVREAQRKELVADSGARTTLLNATFTYTPDTVRRAADTAGANRLSLQAVRLYAPIGLAVVGVALVIGGIVLAMRRRAALVRPADGEDATTLRQRRGRHTGPLSDDTPDSTPTWSGRIPTSEP